MIRSSNLSLACLICFSLIFSDWGRVTTAQDGIAPEPSPLVQQLNAQAAKGGVAMGESINGLARIGQWPSVNYWLINGVAKVADQKQLAEIATAITTPVLLKIRGNAELTPPALAALDKLSKAAKAYAQDSGRLQKAIRDLSGSVDTRLAASRVLLHGGNPAIKEMVAAAVAEPPSPSRDDLLSLGTAMGKGTEQALTQLAIYGTGDARKNALLCLIKIKSTDLLSDLLVALHAPDASKDEIALATAALTRSGYQTLPSQGQALAVLKRQLDTKRLAAEKILNRKQRQTLWTVNATRNGVEFQVVESILAMYREAADSAARMQRVGSLPQEWMQVCLATDMGYRVMADPDWGDEKQVDDVRKFYAASAEGNRLVGAIQFAIEADDKPGAVGLLRLIDGRLSKAANQSLLTAFSPNISPLVSATMNQNPRVRYEAAGAIMRLGPNASFPGKSYFMRCIAEMAQLNEQPIAILVETRSEVILEQEKILNSMGYEVVSVQTVAALEREVARGRELGLILSKTQLHDHPAVELIDRVRRTKLGKDVPILFYGPQVPGISTLRWTGVAQKIERPRTAYAYTNLLMTMASQERMPALTVVDRQLYRDSAADFLALAIKSR